MTSSRVASPQNRCEPKLVQEEIMRNMQHYEAGTKDEAANMVLQHKGISPVAPASGTNASVTTAFHSPSSSETSSLFSTVDCSSFSSRSDASSFAKEEVSLIIPSMSVSVSSSIEFTPSGVDVGVGEQDSGSKVGETNARETGLEGGSEADRKVSIKSDCLVSRKVPEAAPISSYLKGNSVQDDGYETLPVWTDRTRYCSKNIHSCINPCFDKAGEAAEPRTSRRSKLARSLGSVISKHLALSPAPTFRKSSYERFSSRLALGHPSPLSEKCFPATPSRTFEKANSSKSTATEYRLSSAAVSRADVQKPKAKCDAESPADVKTSLYGTSPRRNLDPRKSLGCLGISNGASKALVPVEETSTEVYRGPLYFASEDSVHGGKNRCLPSPRLSFGSGKTPVTLKQDRGQLTNATMSMVTPSSTAHGHLHCIVRGELPSFTFLVDGLEEVLVAKAEKLSSPDTLETGELVYNFYSWKPKGRARGNWKNWVKKDKTIPDFVGKMTLTSKVVPANTKEGDDNMELEFVLLDDNGACSPRLSFSTWETGSSPHANCRPPSPGIYMPSPFSVISPSPGRLPYPASSRYVSLSMVPTNLTSPRVEKPNRPLRRSKRSQNCSPLRAKSDDERSSFQDAWSDTEGTEFPESAEPREHSELAAIVIKVPSGGNKSFETLSQKWGWSKKLNKAAVSSRKSSSYYRRLSLPGRFQTTETKENVLEDKKCNRKEIAGAGSKPTQSFKLRELMGVKDEFGKQDHEHSTITVVLPVGSHGLPLYGTGGPQPLLDRWRSGGRCDCGSWDLGCGLTILEGRHENHHPQNQEEDTIKIFSQGKIQNHVAMSLGAPDDGLFSFSFKAPMSYLQAFASAVAILYSRGPAAVDSETFSKPPRIPLRPLISHQRPEVLVGYCSPPPPCLLDRL